MNVSAASITLNIANFRSQALSSLMSSSADFGSIFASASEASSAVDLPGAAGASPLSSTGRNMSLFDPESAFNMMSVINNDDVTYKAQFSELSQMGSYVSQMQGVGQGLAGITATTGNDDIKTQLRAFVSSYNDWVRRFDADMQQGGLLADTQAAQVSRYELDQSVENVFVGARDGLHGLKDLGIAIDPATKLASFDEAKLDALLASDKSAAVDALQEFGANFARSASLLNSAGNFIPNQLNNLSRAIHYIGDNLSSWQAEFGTGNAATPSGQVAQALAAYNKMALTGADQSAAAG